MTDLAIPEVEIVRDVVPQSEPTDAIRYPVHHCGGPIMPAMAAGCAVPRWAHEDRLVCGGCGAIIGGDDLLWRKAERAWKAERNER